MTKKQAALCLAPTGKGLPSRLSPLNYTRIQGALQDHHQNTDHLNHSSTALAHGSMLEVACHAGKGIVTELQPDNNGDSTYLFSGESPRTSILCFWLWVPYLVFTRLIVRVDRVPYPTPEWLESGVRV
jgi:hypothetical protein